MNILVIIAHPDDEVLGMGGTILKHAKNADKVTVAYMTTGITSRRSSNYQSISSYQTNKKINHINEVHCDYIIKKEKNIINTYFHALLIFPQYHHYLLLLHLHYYLM